MKKDYYKIIFFILLLILFDFISKIIITSNLELGQSINIINNFFKFQYIRNTGAAFGFMMNNTIILIIITIFMIIYLIREIKINYKNKFMIFSLSLIISGAIGNLIDRIFRGYVVDFISFSLYNYEFAIFNIADIYITFGVILLIICIFKEGIYERSNSRKRK